MVPSRYRLKPLAAIVLLGAVTLLATGGCNKLGDEFRAAAGPELQAGVTQLLNGLVDGTFAVVDPDDDEDTSTGG